MLPLPNVRDHDDPEKHPRLGIWVVCACLPKSPECATRPSVPRSTIAAGAHRANCGNTVAVGGAVYYRDTRPSALEQIERPEWVDSGVKRPLFAACGGTLGHEMIVGQRPTRNHALTVASFT